MKRFKTTTYTITTDKIKRTPLKFVMISDLHNVVFGERNRRVFDKIRQIRPDAILIAGDLVLGKHGASLNPARQFLREAVSLAPVLYAPGNHEQRIKLNPDEYGDVYRVYENDMKRLGILYLENREMPLILKGERVSVHGLDLPHRYYSRGRCKEEPDMRALEKALGRPSVNAFNILLAHTPRYGELYFDWGADLILSGHYHGGIIRLPFLGGVVSPDLLLFPRFCHGKFTRDQQTMITGAGLGEHTIPFRINNPRELVVIHCLPKEVSHD